MKRQEAVNYNRMKRPEAVNFKKGNAKAVSYHDLTLFLLVFILSMVGLVFIYSSSYSVAQLKNLPSYYFLRRQLMSLGVGFVLMIVAMKLPLQFYVLRIKRYIFLFNTVTTFLLVLWFLLSLWVIKGDTFWKYNLWLIHLFWILFLAIQFLFINGRNEEGLKYYLYSFLARRRIRIVHFILLFAYVLQIYVLLPNNAGRNGSQRWLEIPGLGTFQVSEISKVAIILFTAAIYYAKPLVTEGVEAPKKKNVITFLFSLLSFIGDTWLVLPLIALIAVENLSSAIIAGAIWFGMSFVGNKGVIRFFLLAGLGFLAVLAYIYSGDSFRRARIKMWLDLEGSEGGGQILQGLYAISSGGLRGRGFGGSVGKISRIPEPYNDMIFAIICEEIGLIGGLIILGLYAFMIIRIYIIASKTGNVFSSLIAVGVMIELSLQVALNIAVVTNLVPSTGITLPFISFGGSSVVMLMFSVGLVMNVSKQIKYFKT